MVSALSDYQQALGARLLHSGEPPAEGLDLPENRLALYERLLDGTIQSCLNGIYPKTRQAYLQALDEKRWKSLSKMYRRQCPNRSFKLLPAVADFARYLAGQPDVLETAPYLVDLARYEWTHAEIQNHPDPMLPDSLEAALPDDLTSHAPVWNPVSAIIDFGFPMPELLNQLDQNQPVNVAPATTTMLIYRDPETLLARYFVLNPLTRQLLLAASADQSYQAAFDKLYNTVPGLGGRSFDAVLAAGESLLAQCLDARILLGSVALMDS